MDEVFRALADPTRRALLDELFREDGQTLSALEERFAMTRFGVMKHLKLLEEAGLVVAQKRGREKLHFLNPVPIRLLHDRWVSKFTAPWAAGLVSLKNDLESRTMEKVYEIYIKTTPERLWEAITTAEIRKHFQFGVLFDGDWSAGSTITMTGDGATLGDAQVLESDPPHRLVHTMSCAWNEEVVAAGTTRVTWEINQVQDSVCLLVTHDQLPADCNPQVFGGWPMILSGLKTWLETGEDLTTPGSLMYVG